MTDPEAALRETLSDEVLRRVIEAAEIYWAIEGPVIRNRKAMRDMLVVLVAPLLPPRAWQPMEELIARRLLFASHGCVGRYGDDGEMQCNRYPFIDFKRDSFAEIERKVNDHGLQRLAEWQAARTCGCEIYQTCDVCRPPAPKERQG